ncbi:MAG: type II toxin-antitoxin system HicA family toxin [Candidatus Yanofskybacteria bacterium]|nr:type II toxin-antitoxin system HicA family toxin [Candidatus Yanofskybacteria bacterium]
MSKEFPAINYRKIAKVAKHLGFYLARTAKGSHEIWRRDTDSRQTTIPNHGAKDINRRTLKAIFEDLEVGAKDLNKILKKL